MSDEGLAETASKYYKLAGKENDAKGVSKVCEKTF